MLWSDGSRVSVGDDECALRSEGFSGDGGDEDILRNNLLAEELFERVDGTGRGRSKDDC